MHHLEKPVDSDSLTLALEKIMEKVSFMESLIASLEQKLIENKDKNLNELLIKLKKVPDLDELVRIYSKIHDGNLIQKAGGLFELVLSAFPKN